MRHRIHIPEKANAGATVAVTGEEFHHAARVVRVRAGEEVEVFDGRGFAASGHIEALAGDHVLVRIDAPIESRELAIDLRLAMAIINLDRFELVLQKATELGVRTIIPTVTDRAEVRPERYRGKGERWERIVFEATKQSGRAIIPTVETPAPFREVIARAGTKVVFDADAEPGEIPAGPATLFIGPEGGWTDEELSLARQHGAAFQRLGPRRLRAETAAIVAVARFT
jgi:16S rRNA (uracil1498-N3)-methyltransferase